MRTHGLPTRTPVEETFRQDLTRIVQRRFGKEARLVSPGPWPHPYRSTAPLEVWGVDGASDSEVVIKRPPQRSMRPPFVRQPDREGAVYSMILEPRDVGAPRLLGTISEPGADANALVLESVDGVPLWQFDDLRVWNEAARWLAQFHALHWQPPATLAQSALLLILDEAHHRRWMRRALKGARARPTGPGSEDTRKSAEWLAQRWDRVVDRLRSVPSALLHGEFYPSNVLVRAKPHKGNRICALDWESTAIGPCLIDLAALTTGWDEASRGQMVETYVAVLGREGLWTPDAEELGEMLDAARVQQAVQWSTWTAQWTPPPEHARDWWREAIEIVEARGW